jgi:putative ABC transport system substrate-binding protein
MNRRQVLRFGTALSAWAIAGAAGAQNRRLARVGFVGGGSASESAASLQGLRDGLAALGYAEPATLRIDARYAEGDLTRVQGIIEDIERAGVDVIVAHARSTLPAVRAKRDAPVVFTLSADPVAVGLTAELSRPQNNATGITLLAAELNLKRMELLREIGPGIQRVAVLYNPQHGGEHLERDWVDRAAQGLGFEPSYHPAGDLTALQAVFAAFRTQPPQAILLLSDAFMVSQRAAILDLAFTLKAPVMAGWGVFVESGALCSYGPRLSDIARRPAIYVDRILRGAKAADLPIERPTTLELVINLEAAQRLGLNLPPAVVGRANRVVA